MFKLPKLLPTSVRQRQQALILPRTHGLTTTSIQGEIGVQGYTGLQRDTVILKGLITKLQDESPVIIIPDTPRENNKMKFIQEKEI